MNPAVPNSASCLSILRRMAVFGGPLLGLLIVSSIAASAAENMLWYDRPATKWEQEALPIGNGYLGAMVFGGVQKERIQFNEGSLWIGDEVDTGAYQAFGDVIVTLDGDAASDAGEVTNPSQNPTSASQSVDATCDGNVTTKWCMENRGRFPVVWQAKMPAGEKAPITSYTLASANDVPDRDPKAWRLLGSQDGKSWALLDERKDVARWPARGASQTFTFSSATAYAYYRFEFLETRSATHFQIAEISLGPTTAKPAAGLPGYRRELDIRRGVHTVTYTRGGVQYYRQYFASYPARAMVFRFTADKPGAYTGTVELTDMHEGKITVEKNRLTSSGSLAGYTYAANSKTPYAIALRYEAQVVVLTDGGSLEAADGRIVFRGADGLTILLDAGTDFVQDRGKGWRGEHPHRAVAARLDAATKTPYQTLLADHVRDFEALAGRVTLNLGPTDDATEALSTDKRLASYKSLSQDPGRRTSEPVASDGSGISSKKVATKDPAMEVLLFQYARYLMISSSRPGTLPANLQGRWNQSNRPPWRCDYHTDINVQMNYWPVEAANLPECFLPYAEWVNSIREVRKAATHEAFHTRGWTMRAENGIFGGSTWQWVESGSAWVAQNLWEHYAFGRDRDYLRDRAYPILKELCQFWEDRLKALPDGTLVAPNGYSPEHGPREDGVSHDQQLVWDLLTNTIEAADALGIDRDYRDKLSQMRDKLLGPKIGRWGQLQEWMVDRDDPKDQHRHLSHLVALHPGRQISPLKTPKLAEAAKISLTARGDGATGWSKAWKINLWARLLDGDHAYKIVNEWVRGSVLPNLFDTCPPFQIDGNFGYTAGACEMLLQSHEDEIHLLPALPSAWPSGIVEGLRARGDFTVDIAWKDGKVTSYRIASPEPRQVKIRLGGQVKTIQSEKL